MIKRHRYLPAAPGDTVIWHYMSIEHFLYLLNNRSLYFSRVDHLDDKAEVLVSDIEKQYWKVKLKNDLNPWIERERKRVFINCWIMSPIEISTMWSAYASKGTGVAIKTTVEKLIKSYQGEEHINILNVNYIDHRTQMVQPSEPPENVLRFFSSKRIYYRNEKEMRLVFTSSRPDEYEFFQIPIDINLLIEELRVGPNAGNDMFDMISTLVPIKGGSFPVKESELLYP